jgi:hypothetical protein
VGSSATRYGDSLSGSGYGWSRQRRRRRAAANWRSVRCNGSGGSKQDNQIEATGNQQRAEVRH